NALPPHDRAPGLFLQIAPRRARLSADLAGEPCRPLADQDLVRQSFCYRPGYTDRMGKTLERADRSAPARRSIHHRCVELQCAKNIRPAVRADGMDIRVRLDQADACLESVQRWSASFEQLGGSLDATRTLAIGNQDHGVSASRFECAILFRNRWMRGSCVFPKN